MVVLGWTFFDCRGIAPACNSAFAAVLFKLCLRQHVPCSLVKIDLAVGHFGQINKAVLQAQQLQIAGRAVERVAAVAGVHSDCHVVVTVFIGNIHRENGLAGLKVQHDVLPHPGGHILHIAVDIARRGGELENRCIAQVISRPDALHLIAAIGFHGVHALDAGRNHAVALCQPVHVIDVGVALDGRVVVGVCQTCVARAEPVADDGAYGAFAVIIDDGRVLNGYLIALGQIIQHRGACHHLAGLHIERKKVHGVLIVGEQHKVRRQGGRAAAAPCKTAAGGLIAFAAHLRADALIRCAPDSLDTVIGTQQIAVLVGQDDRTLLGGGDAVFCTLAGGQFVDKDRLGKVCLLAVQNCINGGMGNIADNALLLALRINAEAARCKPEVSIVVKNHGQKILRQLLAERSLAAALMSMSSTFSNSGSTLPSFVCCAEHQHMIVARGADDAVDASKKV